MPKTDSSSNSMSNSTPGVPGPSSSRTKGSKSHYSPISVEPMKSRLRSGAKSETVVPQSSAKRVSFTGLPLVPKVPKGSQKAQPNNKTTIPTKKSSTNSIKKKIGNDIHTKSQDAFSQTENLDNNYFNSVRFT